MNILQVIPYFHPAYGGPVKIVNMISKSLVEHGHRVTIYTTDASTGDSKSTIMKGIVDIDGIKIHYFKNWSYALAHKHNLFFAPGLLLTARRELRNFDIIHLQDYRNFYNIILHHYAKKYQVPYILQAHGSIPRIITKQRLKKLYDKLWGYRILKDASRLIAVSHVEVKQIQNMGIAREKTVIVPNGLDLAEFSNLPRRGNFRRRYGLNDNQPIVLYLGRIHKIKGLDTLLKAFAHLAQGFAEVRLVIVGPDDGYLTTIKNMIIQLGISSSTLLIGPLYDREKLEAYIDSDVYILPSIHEVFGITVLEACACGLPVILSENCGIADWVLDSRAGLVIKSGDEEQLEAACIKVLNNEVLKKSMGQGGKDLVKEHFDLTRIFKAMEDIYTDCIAGK